MKTFKLWLTRINNIAYNIYTKEDRFIPTSILRALSRSISLFLIINLGFYLAERTIWDHGFIHIGDLILSLYLAAEFAAITYLFFFYKKHDVTAISDKENAIKHTNLKWLKIIKKSEAMKLAQEHEGFCSIEAYCTNKYVWHGDESAYVGQEIEVSSKVLALWFEHRSDQNGSYALLKCLIDNN
ncbi:hypothetical protein VCSRO91_3580 [Vibrio cholerae]|nr:hypothetical protein VCSRO91_3580 [Vibrio cholerae]